MKTSNHPVNKPIKVERPESKTVLASAWEVLEDRTCRDRELTPAQREALRYENLKLIHALGKAKLGY